MGFLIRLFVTAFGLVVAAKIVPGIFVGDIYVALIAAFVLGLVNAVIRPILVILTFPITFLTLGLFILIVNGLMLLLTAVFVDEFIVEGLVAGVLGALVVSIISGLAHKYTEA